MGKESQVNKTPLPKLRRPAAASFLGISLSTLEKFATFGGGPVFYKLGRTVVYDVADLEVWLNERKVSSTSEIDNRNKRSAA
ncbi:MAG: helix-turn-helix domain-containing protein [Magnetococcales bacterium]|nr:helix-turn-helix domain-containing protein [Magnetococcales bacterium]